VIIDKAVDNHSMIKLLLKKPVLAWALYDWANSAFATTIVAGFFPVFYSALSGDISTEDSQFWFNLTLALSSLVVAISAPLLGAISDHGGHGKKFLATFAMLGITMSVSLAWVGVGMWWVALIVYGLGQIGFAGANIFYDSMIVDVSTEEDVDIVSSYGYAMGYIGGGLLFLVNVLMVTKPNLFGIADTSTALSYSFISVGIWWFLFSLPLFCNIDSSIEKNGVTIKESINAGFYQLKMTYREIRKLRVVTTFLLGYWLYIDGVGTIYKMAVFFADRVLGLPSESLITALLLTQFIAFPSALFFGWFAKHIGAKAGIFIGIGVYILVVLYAWNWLESSLDFYFLAAAIGVVQGGVQSLSRSLFTRLIPRNKIAEFFGFFNMVGKFASILGPILMALVPLVFVNSSERDSILVLILLFVSGGYFLFKVDVERGVEQAKALDE
jgi:UMF1 family MFS transporter